MTVIGLTIAEGKLVEFDAIPDLQHLPTVATALLADG
jgi:hypothetical protein